MHFFSWKNFNPTKFYTVMQCPITMSFPQHNVLMEIENSFHLWFSVQKLGNRKTNCIFMTSPFCQITAIQTWTNKRQFILITSQCQIYLSLPNARKSEVFWFNPLHFEVSWRVAWLTDKYVIITHKTINERVGVRCYLKIVITTTVIHTTNSVVMVMTAVSVFDTAL